jgi:hypothetical protein
VPINCTSEDVGIIGNKFLPNITMLTMTANCVPKESEPMETGAFVVLIVLGVIAALAVLAGTSYDRSLLHHVRNTMAYDSRKLPASPPNNLTQLNTTGLLDWWEMRRKQQEQQLLLAHEAEVLGMVDTEVEAHPLLGGEVQSATDTEDMSDNGGSLRSNGNIGNGTVTARSPQQQPRNVAAVAHVVDVKHVGASKRGMVDHPHHHKHPLPVKILLAFSPVRNIVRILICLVFGHSFPFYSDDSRAPLSV